MTTRQFITNAFTNRKDGKCSSVFAENGDVYSYGYHYPLLFRVGGKAIRNVRGYSNTTQRHIMWSRDVEAIDIHAPYSFRLVGDDSAILRNLRDGQKAYIASIEEAMAAKKRKDTQVYKWLQFDLDRANENLVKLMA